MIAFRVLNCQGIPQAMAIPTQNIHIWGWGHFRLATSSSTCSGSTVQTRFRVSIIESLSLARLGLLSPLSVLVAGHIQRQ